MARGRRHKGGGKHGGIGAVSYKRNVGHHGGVGISSGRLGGRKGKRK